MNNKLGKMKGYCICIGLLFFVLLQPCISWAYEKEIRELSSALAENIAKAGKTRIAVVDFTDLQGNVTELGRFIAEEFAVALLSKGKGFEIVDRTHLQTLIKEHKLSATGLIDPATAQKLGQIAGVDALVTGSITPFGDTIRLSVKILDAKTAKLIGANSGNIPATEAINTLLASGIQGGGSGRTSTKPISNTPKLQAEQEVEANGFTFALQKCVRTGSTVTFYFIVTNNKEDRILNTGTGDCIIFDNAGNEYTAALVQVGKESGYWARSTIATGVPVKVSITFEKLSSETNFIKLLDISWGRGVENQPFKTQFRNLQFSK